MSRHKRTTSVHLCLAGVLVLLAAAAGVRTASADEILMSLLVKPQLDLAGTERIFIAPVLLEPRKRTVTPRAASRITYAAPRELERYLFKLLHRETRLTLRNREVELEVEPPTDNLQQLAKMPEFWQDLGRRAEADYIVAAAIDVVVLDRAGYQTEEYVSPADGKTYFRQVLVEETGFSYDILLIVFDGASGEPVHREQITAFKEREEQKLDEYAGMFDDIYTLENRLAGVFVPRAIRAKRFLFR